MKVYLLISDWMHNGDNTVNEVSGVFGCLKKAQKAMAEDICLDLQNHPFENAKCNGSKKLEDYPLTEMKDMFYDNPDFEFDVTSASLWNGDEDISEDYQNYRIEEREIL